MSSQGLCGFRFREQDKLAYNGLNSNPDKLGLTLLGELRSVEDWGAVKTRVGKLNSICESQQPDYQDGILKAELRRHFPNLEFRTDAVDYHDLFSPLQGTLSPYLDGRLSFMPDASDFIYDSSHCEWAYIVTLIRMN